MDKEKLFEKMFENMFELVVENMCKKMENTRTDLIKKIDGRVKVFEEKIELENEFEEKPNDVVFEDNNQEDKQEKVIKYKKEKFEDIPKKEKIIQHFEKIQQKNVVKVAPGKDYESIEPIVHVNNITKRVGGGKEIVKDMSFKIYPGEVLGFLGPNGAGKTTTIRMMLGLISITSGNVKINGYDITKNLEKALENIGGIVENPELYKYMSGYDNLKHFARMYGNIGEDRITEVVKMVGLEKRIKDKVGVYSLGMRQRLGLAQALLNSPKLLILDEPANGLDPAGIKELRDQLQTLSKKNNMAVFISSHLLTEMELMCDRVIIINNGEFVDEQKIGKNRLKEKGEKEKSLFMVDDVQKAYELVTRAGIEAKRLDTGLEVSIEKEKNNEIIAILVKNDIKIYSVQEIKKTLEDRFFEKTANGVIK